jgi:biopolymer transport protein TolR
MAASLEPWNAGRGGRRGPRYRPRAEINVTPFVDVMLVLLIVFMVSAPLLTVGVPLDLPKTEAKALPGDREVLTISIDGEGAIFLQETQFGSLGSAENDEDAGVELEALRSLLVQIARQRAEASGGNPFEERIFIRADYAVQYDVVAKVLATVNAAGFSNIGLVNDPLSR